MLDQVRFLAPAERLTRRLLQLIQRGGDIPAVGAILSAAVARLTGLLSLARLPPLALLPALARLSIVLHAVLDGGGASAALGGPYGVDQLAFAHSASALDSKGTGQLLQLGENHGV